MPIMCLGGTVTSLLTMCDDEWVRCCRNTLHYATEAFSMLWIMKVKKYIVLSTFPLKGLCTALWVCACGMDGKHRAEGRQIRRVQGWPVGQWWECSADPVADLPPGCVTGIKWPGGELKGTHCSVLMMFNSNSTGRRAERPHTQHNKPHTHRHKQSYT